MNRHTWTVRRIQAFDVGAKCAGDRARPVLVSSELDDGRVAVALDRHHLGSVRTVDLAFFHECAVCVAFKSDFRHDVPVILVTGTTEPLSESSVCFHCR